MHKTWLTCFPSHNVVYWKTQTTFIPTECSCGTEELRTNSLLCKIEQVVRVTTRYAPRFSSLWAPGASRAAEQAA